MTNSYKTGTVSVTNGSAVVNGAGTAWAIENVVGGMFRLGTFEAEIIAATNTQLTLDANYTGATASGQAYRIWLQDAQAASNITINRQLGEIIARLVGSAPEIQDFLDADTVALARAAIGAANAAALNASALTLGTVPDAAVAAKYKAALTYLGDVNPNALVQPGWHGIIGASHTNLPKAGYYNIEVVGLAGGYLTQIAWPYGTGITANGFWMRASADGGATWPGANHGWKQIYFAEEQDARYPIKPQAAAGAGQFVAISTALGAGYALPAGGTWVFCLKYVSSAGASDATVLANIVAGGTAVAGAIAGYYVHGFAWRISA